MLYFVLHVRIFIHYGRFHTNTVHLSIIPFPDCTLLRLQVTAGFHLS